MVLIPQHLDFHRLRQRKFVSNIHELVTLEYISDEEKYGHKDEFYRAVNNCKSD